jgi:hypothetical protein
MGAPNILQRRIPPIYPALLGILALILIGQKLQSGVHLNHDVSYFAHLSGWFLQGRSFGTDLLDGNLPMVWALFMPAAALVQADLLAEPLAVRVVFWGYLLISAALLICTLSWAGSRDRAASFGWVFAFVLIATLAPGFSFGQREHACVLFAMPYLAAAAHRLQGERPPRTSIAIAIGVLAGIGFSLKPYFLAVPALIELLLLIRLGWRSLFTRVESCALGCTVVAYVVSAGFFFGDYLKASIELTLSTYWAYEVRDFHRLSERFLLVVRPALFGTLVALVTRTWSKQHTVLVLAGLGFAVSYFVQAKGFVYHAYPILVCSWIYFGICLGYGLPRARVAWTEPGNSLRFILLPAVALLALPPMKQAHDDVVRWYFTYSIRYGQVGQFRQAVIDVVNRFSPTKGSYYFAFTTHPFPGFPTASYTNADWSGRMMLQSLIPAYARVDEVADRTLREQVLRAGEFQRRMVIEDFERRPPTVVFAERNPIRFGMNGRQFDDIAFYLGDPRFQQIWKNYEERPPMGPLRVFVRRSIDPGRP